MSELPTWAILGVLVGAGAATWFAGAKLANYADEIAGRTGLGRAFAGAILLAGMTSLPELSISVTSAIEGRASLATNNLLGSAALQIAVLAIADLVALRGALTFFTPSPSVLMQGVLQVLLLGLVVAFSATEEPVALGGVGLLSVVLFVVYGLTLWQNQAYERAPRWRPHSSPEESTQLRSRAKQAERQERVHRAAFEGTSNPRLYGQFAAFGLGVLVAGFFTAQVGDVLTQRTGLAEGVVGAVLVAPVGSIPELSTTIEAARLSNYDMAFGNIFGSNAFLVGLILPVDIAFRGGPVLEAVEPGTTFVAALGIVLSCIYLWGLLERGNRTIGRLGVDSALVVATYLAGIAELFAAF